MIPALTRCLRERHPETAGKPLTLIKWNNGVGYRNPKVSFLALCNGQPFLFLKTVRFARDNDAIRQAHGRLAAAQAVASSVSPACVMPVSRWIADVSGYAVSAESIVPGSPIRTDVAEDARGALEWLHGFSAVSPASSVDAATLRSVAWRVLEDIKAGEEARRALGEEFEAALAAFNAGTASNVRGDSMIPTKPAHGDFTPFNVLADVTGRIGVIDWDGYGTIETPLFDLLTFIDRVTPTGENPYERFRRDLDRALAGVGSGTNLLPLAVLLYVLMTDWRKRAQATVDGTAWDRRLLESLERRRRWVADAGRA